MNGRALIPLIVGLGIGGFALKIGIDKLQAAKGAQTATVTVWAAAADIPRGNEIREPMLKPLPFPAKLVPAGAFRDEDKQTLLGRVPRVDAPAGLPLLDGNLMPPGQIGRIHVPLGYRAVGVKIDEGSGVDFHLEPGCRVDVVGCFTIKRNNKQEKVARTIIENVEVAAVGPRLSSVDVGQEGKAARPPRAVTLLITPEKVKDLHLAEQQGKIKLCRRNINDSGSIRDSEPISIGELIDPTLAGPEDTKDQTAPQGKSPDGGFLAKLGGMWSPSQTSDTSTEPAPPVVAPAPVAVPAWYVFVYRGGKSEIVPFKDRYSRERITEDAERPPAVPQTPGASYAPTAPLPPAPVEPLQE